MSSVAPPFDKETPFQGPRRRPLERGRGRWAMWLFIASEAMLFAMLFFSYFYLGASNREWPTHEDPKMMLALVLLAVLLMSSVVMHWAERSIKKGRTSQLTLGLGLTLLLGCVFLFFQYLEYKEHFKSLTPWMDAYGSIFYTITSFHLAHLLLGMFMIGHVFARSIAGHFSKERHLAVQNVAGYWHFVDIIWVFIVLILYVSPRLYP